MFKFTLRSRQNEKSETFLLLSVALLVAVNASCGSKTAAPPPEEPSLAQGESSTWRVAVLSVKEARDYSDTSRHDIGVISLKLRVTYLGPAASLKPPAVHILSSFLGNEHKGPPSGVTFEGGQPDAETIKILGWLVAGQGKPSQANVSQPEESISFETGKKFSGILDFRYVRGAELNFRLAYADVPPIPLNVQRGN